MDEEQEKQAMAQQQAQAAVALLQCRSLPVGERSGAAHPPSTVWGILDQQSDGAASRWVNSPPML